MYQTPKKKTTMIALIVFAVVAVIVGIISKTSGVDFGFAGTAWALLPPFLAISLALITKEVYSSLFLGIVMGALMAANYNFADTVSLLTVDGISAAVADTAGIFVFLVILGIIVAMVNRAGASQAFGRWAQKNIKTKTGALLATFALGVLIFIDDYFNCLTVGSVMMPVTDSKGISRPKLAYIIDATAAPVCMIAPISSWAAAVSSYAEGTSMSGIQMFIKAIPYNFYSLLTFVFIIGLALMKFDFGKMREFEIKAEKTGDLSKLPGEEEMEEVKEGSKGKVMDLILPVLALVALCVVGLVFNGYQAIEAEGFSWAIFIDAFSNTDSYVGLPWGGLIALVVIIAYMMIRKLLTFEECMECVPKGFIAMVPAILILTFATALKNMTGALDAATFVGNALANAEALQWLLPAVVFIVACLIAFATGTSWGTFGILIPIVIAIFPEGNSLFFVGMSACLAGAVCGDHCSPISDTTIMSSAGAHCNHIDHVSTQLPYAISVAGISFVAYLIAGLASKVDMTWISLPIGAVMVIAYLFVMKKRALKLDVAVDAGAAGTAVSNAEIATDAYTSDNTPENTGESAAEIATDAINN